MMKNDINLIDQHLKTQRINFGKKILGPIFYDFCQRLHLYFLSYDNRQTVFLFCTRAGLRLKYLYEMFLKSQDGIQPANQTHLLWISRYMTAKGLFERNRRAAFQVIANEFNHTLVSKMLPCLLPSIEPEKIDFQNELSSDILSSKPTGGIVETIFANSGEFGDRLRKHYSSQAKLFEHQINTLTAGKELAVLIDTGWQATTQRLLMEGYPEIDWHGLYFGRMGSVQANNWHFFNVIGLMFEAFDYEPHKIETCIHYYHHIIEDLLEPNLPSVEYLRLDEKSNRVLPPPAYDTRDYWTPGEEEHHYQGVVEYFQNQQEVLNLLEVRRRSKEAWKILNEKIRFPSPQDVDIMDVGSRSADFGKREKNPVVLRRANRLVERTREVRLQHSLWKQAQIAIEYGERCKSKQQDFAKKKEKEKPRNNKILVTNAVIKIPSVAVITRTKNRPVMLKRAAKSVASQAFQDFVWVVVNDGGDPKEVEQIVDQSPVDLRKVIIVHNPESLGMEAASNRAIAHSKSKYLVIHDDDDSWQPQFLAHTVDFLENPPVPCMRGVIAHAKRISEVIVDDEYVEIVDSCPYQEWVMTIPLYEMASMNMFAPISFLFAREVYEEIGGFDEQLPVLGDWDFNIRFLMKYDIGVIPEQLANYHHRDYLKSGNYSNSLQGAISKHQMYEAIVRNRGLRQITKDGGISVASILSLGRATYDIRGMVQELLRTTMA